MMKGAALIFLAVLAVVLVASPGEAVSCGDVVNNMEACRGYLSSGGGTPPEACCNGVRAVAGSAQSSQDRQAVCNCLKGAAGGVSGLNYNTAAGLPGQCGVSIGYSVSPDVNCEQVS